MSAIFNPLERVMLFLAALVFGLWFLNANAQEPLAPPTKEQQEAQLLDYQRMWKQHEESQIALHQKAEDLRLSLCTQGHMEYCKIATKTFTVNVTNYNPEAGQTDGSPCNGAGMTDMCALAKQGKRMVALSQDLVGRTPSKPFTYGDKVLIEHERPECSGVFEVHDTMNARFTNYVDVFHMTRAENFGLCRGATLRKVVNG